MLHTSFNTRLLKKGQEVFVLLISNGSLHIQKQTVTLCGRKNIALDNNFGHEHDLILHKRIIPNLTDYDIIHFAKELTQARLTTFETKKVFDNKITFSKGITSLDIDLFNLAQKENLDKYRLELEKLDKEDMDEHKDVAKLLLGFLKRYSNILNTKIESVDNVDNILITDYYILYDFINYKVKVYLNNSVNKYYDYFTVVVDNDKHIRINKIYSHYEAYLMDFKFRTNYDITKISINLSDVYPYVKRFSTYINSKKNILITPEGINEILLYVLRAEGFNYETVNILKSNKKYKHIIDSLLEKVIQYSKEYVCDKEGYEFIELNNFGYMFEKLENNKDENDQNMCKDCGHNGDCILQVMNTINRCPILK